MLVLEQLIENFGLLGGVHGDGTEGELFGKMAIVFLWVKSLSSGKIEKTWEENGAAGAEAQTDVEEMGDVGMTDMMAGMDDTWLSEMLGSWNYDFMSK